MATFSERMGFRPVRSVIQVDGIDDAFANRLWTLIYTLLDDGHNALRHSNRIELYRDLWLNLYERPIDEMFGNTSTMNDFIKKQFYAGEWHEKYSLLEAVIQHIDNDRVYEAANAVCERYLGGYRFIGKSLAPIHSSEEIQSIEEALTVPLESVRRHLRASLNLLGNIDSPDPGNAIKESISAVEAMCNAITDQKATLSTTLKKLETSGVTIHPALSAGWQKLYAYTSDAQGIRHAFSETAEPPSVADATYMLVTCSAFIGLLASKATEADIELR